MKPIILVAGPTAVGKTKYAINLAKELNTEIISVDSVQVYCGMDIGSAKPSKSELLQVKHHMIDVVDPDDAMNAARFCKMAEPIIAKLHAENRTPVLCGGTSLYIKALIFGLTEFPKQDPLIRQNLENKSITELYLELQEKAPRTAARLHPNDKLRIIRALEIYYLTGIDQDLEFADKGFKKPLYEVDLRLLEIDRKILYQRINERTEAMLADGLIPEVESLLSKYPANLTAFNTVGYREVISYLAGKLTYEQMLNDISMYTRRYAKQQLTFWRGWNKVSK